MILPAAQDRSIVVFAVWPSLGYGARLGTSFVLVLAGIVAQMATGSFLWGLPLLIVGNVLLLVRGYDNRVEFGKFDPAADWERADVAKLDDLRRLDREISRWDTSTLDVSNVLGLVVFVVVAGSLGAIVALSLTNPGPLTILALDAAVLLLPHWLTGTRRVLRLPGLLVKVDVLRTLFDVVGEDLKRHRVHLLMLLRGEGTRIPEDVKFKVDVRDRRPDFLGLYGQVVLNEVQGRSYPYFYVVLVAKRGFGLGDLFRAYRQPFNITAEFDVQDEVEVLVIRKTTTKTSGYHTKPDVVIRIFREGLTLAESAAPGRT